MGGVPNPFAPTGPAATAFNRLGGPPVVKGAAPYGVTKFGPGPQAKPGPAVPSNGKPSADPFHFVHTILHALSKTNTSNAGSWSPHGLVKPTVVPPDVTQSLIDARQKSQANDSSSFGHPSKSVPDTSSTPHSTLIADAKAVTDPNRSTAGVSGTTTAATDPYSGFSSTGSSIGTMLNPNLAAKIASGTWDPVIGDYQNQISELPGQTKQNKADITNWIGQVLTSLASGKKTADAGYDTGAASAGNTASGILASLGGSDSGSAGMLAQSGANASAMMQALKGNNDAFSADMTPILNLEKEGQLSNQDASQSFNMRQLQQQLAGAQSSKAGDTASNSMSINSANNALAQQRWANAFGVQQQSDANSVAQGQATNAATNSYISNLEKVAQTNKINAGLANPAPVKGSFDATAPATRTKLATNIISGIQGYLQKNPNAPASVLDGMVKHAVSTSGWDPKDPKVMNWINSIYQTININPQTQGFNTPTG